MKDLSNLVKYRVLDQKISSLEIQAKINELYEVEDLKKELRKLGLKYSLTYLNELVRVKVENQLVLRLGADGNVWAKQETNGVNISRIFYLSLPNGKEDFKNFLVQALSTIVSEKTIERKTSKFKFFSELFG